MNIKNLVCSGLLLTLISLSIQAAERNYAPLRAVLEQAEKERQESQQIGEYQNNPVPIQEEPVYNTIPEQSVETEEPVYNTIPPSASNTSPVVTPQKSQRRDSSHIGRISDITKAINLKMTKSPQGRPKSLHIQTDTSTRDSMGSQLKVNNNTPHNILVSLRNREGKHTKKILNNSLTNITVSRLPIGMTIMHDGLSQSTLDEKNPVTNPILNKVLVDKDNLNLEFVYENGNFKIYSNK